jgi:hypothetical protein
VGGETFAVRLQEGFASAFKLLGVPAVQAGSGIASYEAGYCTPGSGAAPTGDSVPGGNCSGGGADQATRFILIFTDLLPKLLKVPGVVTGSGNLELRRVLGATTEGVGGALTLSAAVTPVDGSAGYRYAVYEVTNTNSLVLEYVDVPVFTKKQGGQGGNSPWTVRNGKVFVGFAPLTTIGFSNPTAPVPRFLGLRVLPTDPPGSGFSGGKVATGSGAAVTW